MKISVMEKAYKGVTYVFYINGFPAFSYSEPMLNQACEILRMLKFEITSARYVSELLNDIPNNERKFEYKGPSMGQIKITEYPWKVNQEELFNYGFNIEINGEFGLNSYVPIKEGIKSLLETLGYEVEAVEGEKLEFDPEEIKYSKVKEVC